ncbi:MFS transporter [Bradyrhizobium sp. U87765 SZCCT0131]|uniref:MFS transporter n=1 Tax=unclassified Bradyrhizobium TaxID=2631580 RepID=UPI001BAE369B|nr:MULTISPECIES: MFS transporter [unclassified Bradyrhizobium]MBR1218964.1 MFS transporter [Bradyrhizobium sp. U87765 SZCCT0131]MBR1261615.1 MFS transporter [Bradyrhizobium sp. U87765 SZCCT0134]MBR1306532.1 MFS transporter [Bradyrhizobium sp. U87765 SZCCT0110]MBR1317397.1 MFS transporter [Bradyrhizobium sp. U87765 SZCCT0109]MBR1351099.1 MFS transporter [Bradyrhizobium sp. U87765 SZCCT0048]
MTTDTDAIPHARDDASPGVAMLAMFGLLLASYVINAMDRQIFPLLAADVRKEYGFSLADTGLLSTIFTLGMAVAGWPTGYLLARTSRKAVLQIGIAIFSAGTVLTAFATGFADMLIYRAATGIGEAMQLTALIAIATTSFTRYRGVAVGAINASFGVGAIVGPLLAGIVLSFHGSWHGPIVAFGIIGFVAMGVIAVAVRPAITEVQRRAHGTQVVGGATTLFNRNTVILTLLSLIGGLIIYGYLGMYPTFLREQLHVAPADTGAIMSIYGLGVLCSLIGGWFGDRFSPRAVFGLAFLGAAALGFLLFAVAQSFAAHAALSFLWGFIVSGTIYVNLAGSHVKAVDGALAGRASGVFVTSLYGAAAIAGYLIGFIASLAGWSQAGLVQITLLSVIGAVLALGLDGRAMSRTVR